MHAQSGARHFVDCHFVDTTFRVDSVYTRYLSKLRMKVYFCRYHLGIKCSGSLVSSMNGEVFLKYLFVACLFICIWRYIILRRSGDCKIFKIYDGQSKKNWELSNISWTMNHNLLKIGMFPSKECDVILHDVILRSPFALWKSKKKKAKTQLRLKCE